MRACARTHALSLPPCPPPQRRLSHASLRRQGGRQGQGGRLCACWFVRSSRLRVPLRFGRSLAPSPAAAASQAAQEAGEGAGRGVCMTGAGGTAWQGGVQVRQARMQQRRARSAAQRSARGQPCQALMLGMPLSACRTTSRSSRRRRRRCEAAGLLLGPACAQQSSARHATAAQNLALVGRTQAAALKAFKEKQGKKK